MVQKLEINHITLMEFKYFQKENKTINEKQLYMTHNLSP
jgi:hypothetical protein